MRHSRLAVVWIVALAIVLAGGLPTVAVADEAIDFTRDIRPILSDKCFRCHGPDHEQRKADLRLDREDDAKADRDAARAIVPGKPQASELMVRVTADDEFLRMPPNESGKTLSAAEIDLLRRWIEQGAPWSQHWAYVPPRRHRLPPVERSDWPINWVDRFILARLEAEGFEPAPPADRVTLLRRLHFDLVGLPPTPQEVSAFLADPRPDAYRRRVDRLLASPHFGERLAVFWLDLVRYADTVGYHGDQDHSISPYRDWVIDALNRNMPFDRFTRCQLAGDLLPGAGVDEKIATGYNRLLQTSHEGGVQPKEYLAIYAADRVRNVSAVWMGGTLGCAQCHDHKYDPYTMRDFYSMQAFFADVDEAQHFRVGGNSLPTRRPPEMDVLTRRDRQQLTVLESRITELQKRLDQLKTGSSTTAEKLKQQITTAQQIRDRLQKKSRKTMVTVAIQPRTIRILPRGNWLDDSGPVVEPAVPEFLDRLESPGSRPTRLDLADWLVDPDGGAGKLTARVQANRLWYLLFGVAPARDMDDLGGQGEPPVYPQLLDNLAMELIDSGWDIKHLLRLIANSAAYRQSSRAADELLSRDPDNRLYARQSRFRLPAEMIRDNALAVSGLLVRELGGRSVRPYQPAGYYRHLNFPKRTYQHDNDRRQYRRGVYVHWQRQFLHPMLKAFDSPRREECTAGRPESNTPLAALVLLNDPSFVEAARVFAERALRQGGTTFGSRLDFIFRRAVSREPDATERKELEQLLSTCEKHYRSHPEDAVSLVKTGLAPAAGDLDPAELAAWTTVCRAVLNMNETITRN